MSTRAILYGVLTVLCADASGQVVTPSAPVVAVGQTRHFTADRAVTWSLLPGSAGSIELNGTYHAPATIVAPKAIGGCQIGAPDSVFNTRIDNLPLHPNNVAWMDVLPARGVSFTPAWGINVGDNTTPSRTFSFNYTPLYNSQLFLLPSWPNLKRESGVFSDPLTEVDRHVMTVNRQTCQVYEIYNNYSAGTAGANPPASTYTAQSGWQYPSVSYGLPTSGSTSASGIPLLAATLNLDDIRSGIVRHVMLVTFANGYIDPSFIWPATSNAGAYGGVPYGTRLRLKSTFDISGYSPTAQIMLTALKNYGMILSDGGSNWDIITSTDVTADRAVQSAIQEIRNSSGLDKSQFEVVDEAALMVSPGSSQVAYNNGYVTPPAYAIVKADDGVHPPVTIPIALQGVALNSPEGGGIWIQSGVTRTLNVYASDTFNTSVIWAMSPALGRLDPVSGVFVAPSVSEPTMTSITATSVADPAVSVTFPLTVLPPGPIRITAGDATGNPAAPRSLAPDYGPDSQGNVWWRDKAVERSWGVKNDYWYGGPWPSSPDVFLYQTQYYNIGDTIYRFLVPNGNYDIDYYVAQGGCNASNKISELAYREHLEAQGQIAFHDYRPLATVGGNCYTPIHTKIPAQVTDNTLYFALRRVTDHTQSAQNQTPATILSAFSITPATDIPHLSVDPAAPPPLTVSQALQLYAVGWYMSNSVTWSLVSGPGSISSSGIYTSPATPVNGTAVVRATSTVDPSQTATLQINLVFGAIKIAPDVTTLNRSAVEAFAASIGSQLYPNVTWSLSPNIGTITPSGIFVAPDTLAADTRLTITATSNDDPAHSATASVNVLANPLAIRVNCSDVSGFTDAQGKVWATDYGFSGNSLSYSVSNVPVALATPDLYPLYASSRYTYPNQAFQYDFPVPNGFYEVTLKFTDYAFSGPGHYDFDVLINGVLVLRNFDPDAVYGISKVAVDETFQTSVTGKNITIAFVAHQGGAQVNGIEIVPVGASSRRISGNARVLGRAR